MKNISFLILLILLNTILCFGQKKKKRFTEEISAENSVEYCDDCIVESGVLPFTIWVKHRKEENALKLAKKAAIETVLLRGVPGSPVSQPIVSYTQYQQNKGFFEKFTNSAEGENFIGKATVVPGKTFKIKSGPFKNGYEAGIDIEVMYDNLKRYLIQNKIIKFGL
ncbi:hypothetical protein [Arcticibacterium luteifluviistationis]|uniref:Uncharacterized protein n=1 Tax=Arcticibacterium luteifluviistationis TaxID=1784714 RepID=A0A2Z4G8Z4_9BACT|nr:hypothetical protein [Arcticibacterium luteifluviistationis]AWV97692.1 hypothetical protein DJ013_05735 [Arcticibacterium luteifluviistationis]